MFHCCTGCQLLGGVWGRRVEELDLRVMMAFFGTDVPDGCGWKMVRRARHWQGLIKHEGRSGGLHLWMQTAEVVLGDCCFQFLGSESWICCGVDGAAGNGHFGACLLYSFNRADVHAASNGERNLCLFAGVQ